MSTIQDTLTYADGSLANGRLVVTWKPFTVNNSNVGGGELEYEIVDGNVTVTLYSNANAQPLGSYYTAKYELENGAVYNEYWIIPSLQTVTLGQVRVSFPPTPSVMISPLQLTSLNGQPGMFLMWDGTHWVPSYPTIANFPGASQTPWISNIEGAGFQLNNAGGIGIGAPADAPAVGVYVQSTPTGGAVYGLMHVSKNPNGAASVYLQSDVNYTFVMALYSSQGGINQNRARLDSTGVDMIFGTGSAANNLADRVHITQAGLVGVGRIPTAYPLEVAGDLNLVGGVYRVDGVPFALAPDSSVQQLQFALAGVLKSTRHQLNFVAGSGVNLNLVDDSPNNQGTLTITAVSTGAPSPSIFSVNGTQVGTQPELNLIASTGVTLGGVNNTGAGRVDITVTSSVTGGVTSVFTRTGAVVAASADYSAFYPLLAGSYVNPAWIISIPWSKITGAPSVASYQTPWVTDIVGAGHQLSGVSAITTAYLAVVGVGTLMIGTTQLIAQVLQDQTNYRGLYFGYDSSGQIGVIAAATPGVDSNLAFYTYSAGWKERMRIVAGGNVGIGTAAPVMPLSVLGTQSGAFNGVVIANIGGTVGETAALCFALGNPGGTPTASIANVFMGSGLGDLAFSTFNSSIAERMRITAAGLVGIGTVIPAGPIHSSMNGVGAAAPAGGLVMSRLWDGTNIRGGAIFNYYDSTANRDCIAISVKDTTGNPWAVDSGIKFVVSATGNIGMGVLAPLYPLQVSGYIVAQQSAAVLTSIGLDPSSGVVATGIRNAAFFYNSAIEMGQIEAIQAGQVWRNLLACPHGSTSFCVGSSWLNGFVPQALCDFSNDVVGDVDILKLRCGIAAQGDGPALVFGQNSGSALLCRLKALYNTARGGMDLAFWAYDNNTASAERMRIVSNGSICIGATSPTGRLTVVGAGGWDPINTASMTNICIVTNGAYGGGIGMIDAARTMGMWSNGGDWLFGNGTTSGGLVERMRISAAGLVGINTVAPNYTLTVAGDCNITGTYRVNGAPFGAITTRSIATGSRVQGTVYQNTVGKPMFVCVTSLINANSYMQLLTDGSNPPSTIASAMTNSSTSIQATMTISGWVMPGEFYKAFSSGGTLSTWIEWW